MNFRREECAMPLSIGTTRGERAGGGAREFRSVDAEGNAAWRVRAVCKWDDGTWNASIRLFVASGKLTWSSEKGTQVYTGCVTADAQQ
jgi:hypothetical protein